MILALAGAMLLTACNTQTGAGAYVGASLGSVLGSAIGGIVGGPRGSDIGTVVGMAGGAAVGAAAADAAQKKYEPADRYSDNTDDYGRGGNDCANGSGFDETNSGDDRLYDFQSSDYQPGYQPDNKAVLPERSTVERIGTLRYAPQIVIRNARFIDSDGDNCISRGEVCKLIFEVHNTGSTTLYDVVPTVVDATNNKQINISPSVHVERILPGGGIRYTAAIKGGNRLKNGRVCIRASVVQGEEAVSKVSEFNITTKK